MPQLDFSTFLGQIAWLCVAFMAIFVMVRFVFAPKIEARLQSRERAIQDDLANAELAIKEAKATRADMEHELQKTRDEAHSMYMEAEVSIKNMLEAKSVQAENQALAQLKEETKKIEQWRHNEIAIEIPRIAQELKKDILSLLLKNVA